MKTRSILILVCSFLCMSLMAQPAYREDIQKERLNRGLVAVKTADGKVAVSWRILSSDAKNAPFDVLRNGKKINAVPLTDGGSFFIDEHPLEGDVTYSVGEASYTLHSNAPQGYLPIRLQKPKGGKTPDGLMFEYEANDASVGDVDGDGELEIILKWYPTNAHDNAHDGFGGNTLFDCYKLDGTLLWRIDLGRNIRSGAHYSPFLVYDFDGDGSAELIIKTADGTIDGAGRVIGDSTKDYRRYLAETVKYYNKHKEQVDAENERIASFRARFMNMNARPQFPPKEFSKTDFRKMHKRSSLIFRKRGAGRILEGPEYLTVFSGRTGEALKTINYIPPRGRSEDWGDDNGNRCERYLAAVAYLDGMHPSAVMCRGYYTRTVLATFDWDGNDLKMRWVFDSNDEGNGAYAGQGNHNLRIGDVDADGCDEIVYGSCTIDNDGKGLYSTGLGHGDAMHMTAFIPGNAELQVWDCHENHHDGATLRSARTGEMLMQTKCDFDNGRCMAADIIPHNEGVEMWSLASDAIYNYKGEKVGDRGNIPINFAVWWDGDLLREMLDRSQVSKYNWETGRTDVICRFDGTTFNNGSKQNPCLSGDIIGDWREEVLTRTLDSRELRLYISPIPTPYRMNCLLEDVPYRMSIAAQNVAYNQPPEVGFYLGEDDRSYLK
ncbi:MAG: rhamnogalacturonan lyase [Prevotella sp.]|nr:rhamnogalacturonan lyase [Candidatus Equicola faecalis]